MLSRSLPYPLLPSSYPLLPAYPAAVDPDGRLYIRLPCHDMPCHDMPYHATPCCCMQCTVASLSHQPVPDTKGQQILPGFAKKHVPRYMQQAAERYTETYTGVHRQLHIPETCLPTCRMGHVDAWVNSAQLRQAGQQEQQVWKRGIPWLE